MIGQTISHYRIVDKLGEGGMGAVYQAEDVDLGRPVALKFLAAHLLNDDEAKQRFIREAKAAAAITHPNICHVYEVGEAVGKTFLAMAYLEGESLEDRIAKGPLPLRDALDIGRQVAEGLEAAHEKGIVHRDIKPANIMVDAKGRATILDFGLARLTEASKLTRPDQTVGTAAYMSPEQMQGGEVDQRTDIWALGCVLYEMVAGVRPFPGQYDQALAYEIVNQDPEPLTGVRAGVPMELEIFVGKCLAKDAADRYGSAAELAKDLRTLGEKLKSGRSQILRTTSAPSAPETPADPVRRWIPAALFACVLGVAVGGAAVYWAINGPAAQQIRYRLRQVTFDDGLSFEPSLSQDGNLMAYSSDVSGRGDLDIWVRQVTGGNPIRLTDHPADDRQPDISPDGSRVAFRSDRNGGGIYVGPALGGEAVLVVGADPGSRGPLHPRFSPDGKRLAYWVGSETLHPRAARNQAFVVSATGGEPHQIAENLVSALLPIWSTDGESLLVLGSDGGELDWWLTPAAGGRAKPTEAAQVLREAFALPNGLMPYPWAWDAGSEGVYFASVSGTNTIGLPRLSNLWALPISPQSGQVNGNLLQVTAGPGAQLMPSATPTGTLAFADADVNPNIWSAPLDPERFVLTGGFTPVLDAVSWESRPSASRDGRFLAFRSDRSGGWDFWIKDLESGATRQLTRDGENKSPAVFLSSDGSRAAYTQGRAVHVVETSGSATPRKLCDSCLPVGWLSDNRHLLGLARQQEQRGLIVVNTDTGQSREVDGTNDLGLRMTGIAGGAVHVDASGDWIAVEIRDPEGTETLRMIPWGRLQKGAKIIDGPAGSAPHFHPSGRALFFRSSHEGSNCLSAIRLDPESKQPVGEPFVVRHFHDRRFPLRGQYSISHDRVFVGIHETKGNIWMMEPADGPNE